MSQKIASRVGRATAVAFAREGASVVNADVSDEEKPGDSRKIEELGARAVRCDVFRAEDVKAALNKGLEAFGRLFCA